jgi:BlaI family transcriptional regulator, penicillinase repressor
VADIVPSERELEALKVIWQRGEATIREICDAINERGAELAYTTVLSLLQVMEQKGLVGHRASGRHYTYFAKISRERTFRQLAGGFLERVFDGAMDEYVLHALGAKPVSPDELARLEELIAQARQRGSSKSGRSASDKSSPRSKRKDPSP